MHFIFSSRILSADNIYADMWSYSYSLETFYMHHIRLRMLFHSDFHFQPLSIVKFFFGGGEIFSSCISECRKWANECALVNLYGDASPLVRSDWCGEPSLYIATAAHLQSACMPYTMKCDKYQVCVVVETE